MSITPFEPDNRQSQRIDAIAKLLKGYALLSEEAAAVLGEQVAELGGEVDIVKRGLAEAAGNVKALEARVDSVEAAQENGTSAPTHKMFIWAGIEEQKGQGGQTGSLLTHVCKHHGFRDEFTLKRVDHPVFDDCGSYTYEVWSWFFKEMGLKGPSFMEKVIPAQFTYWSQLKFKLKKYKSKFGY